MTGSWAHRVRELSDEQMSVLLSLAGTAGGSASWLPGPSDAIEHSRRILESLPALADGRPATWLEEIAAPAVSLARLVEIKRSAKQELATTSDDDLRVAWMLAYHAAVAAAFARHDTVISSRPLGLRLGLYDGLGSTLRGHPIGAVFSAAVERYLAP